MYLSASAALCLWLLSACRPRDWLEAAAVLLEADAEPACSPGGGGGGGGGRTLVPQFCRPPQFTAVHRVPRCAPRCGLWLHDVLLYWSLDMMSRFTGWEEFRSRQPRGTVARTQSLTL